MASIAERVSHLEGWRDQHDKIDAEDREALDDVVARVGRIEAAILVTPRRATVGGLVGSGGGALVLWLLNFLADRIGG